MIITSFEKKLLRSGYDYVVGIDEAGRGPWAGPVSIAGYAINLESESFDNINDSKKVSEKKREELFDSLTADSGRFFVTLIDNQIIDDIGVYKATQVGILQVLSKFKDANAYVIIDGHFTSNFGQNTLQESGADGKFYSVAAASIIAKVTRDRLMLRMSDKYPKYGFDKHKGYGTKFHREMLEIHGPCKIHRTSFKPIQKLLQGN